MGYLLSLPGLEYKTDIRGICETSLVESYVIASNVLRLLPAAIATAKLFKYGKFTVQCLLYKELTAHNLLLSSVWYNQCPIITASYLKVLQSVNPGNNPCNNCLFRAISSNIDLRQVLPELASSVNILQYCPQKY